MATSLENKLKKILKEKNEKIIPENIKAGVTIFDIQGTYENNPEYTDLEYIESTGLEYIDTMIKGTNLTSIEIKFYNEYSSSVENCILGSRIFPGTNGLMLGFYQGGWCCYGNNQSTIMNMLNKLNIVKLDKGNVYYYDSSNSDFVLNKTFSIDKFTTPSNIILFGERRSNDVSMLSKIRLYYCKIYENDKLIRDLIPVKDITGTVCLYDKVNKTFLYNAGTGNFIAGGVI